MTYLVKFLTPNFDGGILLLKDKYKLLHLKFDVNFLCFFFFTIFGLRLPHKNINNYEDRLGFFFIECLAL